MSTRRHARADITLVMTKRQRTALRVKLADKRKELRLLRAARKKARAHAAVKRARKASNAVWHAQRQIRRLAQRLGIFSGDVRRRRRRGRHRRTLRRRTLSPARLDAEENERFERESRVIGCHIYFRGELGERALIVNAIVRHFDGEPVPDFAVGGGPIFALFDMDAVSHGMLNNALYQVNQ